MKKGKNESKDRICKWKRRDGKDYFRGEQRVLFLFQGKKVICDCDVDAANLFSVMGAKILEEEDFLGGEKAHTKREICTACSMCIEVCEFGAISPNHTVDPILVEIEDYSEAKFEMKKIHEKFKSLLEKS